MSRPNARRAAYAPRSTRYRGAEFLGCPFRLGMPWWAFQRGIEMAFLPTLSCGKRSTRFRARCGAIGPLPTDVRRMRLAAKSTRRSICALLRSSADLSALPLNGSVSKPPCRAHRTSEHPSTLVLAEIRRVAGGICRWRCNGGEVSGARRNGAVSSTYPRCQGARRSVAGDERPCSVDIGRLQARSTAARRAIVPHRCRPLATMRAARMLVRRGKSRTFCICLQKSVDSSQGHLHNLEFSAEGCPSG